MTKIVYVESDGSEKTVDVRPGLSVMEGAVRNDVRGVYADCGGACACATCHVHVDAAWSDRVGPPSKMEADMLEFVDNLADNSRLSCQIAVADFLDGLIVRIP